MLAPTTSNHQDFHNEETDKGRVRGKCVSNGRRLQLVGVAPEPGLDGAELLRESTVQGKCVSQRMRQLIVEDDVEK
jgi:hypothetical protein